MSQVMNTGGRTMQHMCSLSPGSLGSLRGSQVTGGVPLPRAGLISNLHSGFCGSEKEALVWAPGFQFHLPQRRVKQGPGPPLCEPLSLGLNAGGGWDLCGPPDILGLPGPLAPSARKREDISQDNHGSCLGLMPCGTGERLGPMDTSESACGFYYSLPQ